MSSAPAYRYDHAATRPARHLESAPSVRVVPGRKHAVYPTLSDGAVLGIKAIIACVIVFLVIGFVRVGLSAAAYSIASQSSDLRAQISDARTTGESLAVQESLLSNPNNIRTEAGERRRRLCGIRLLRSRSPGRWWTGGRGSCGAVRGSPP